MLKYIKQLIEISILILIFGFVFSIVESKRPSLGRACWDPGSSKMENHIGKNMTPAKNDSAMTALFTDFRKTCNDIKH
jgi:hypothetical protein